MPAFCADDPKADVIKLLKRHCRSRPFRKPEGVVGNGSTLESEDTKVRYSASEEDIGGVRDFVRKVNLTSNDYQVSWVCDGDLQDCMLCSEPFTLFRRKHHCRGCGYIICYNCFAETKIRIKALSYHEKKSIACFKCVDRLRQADLRKNSVDVTKPTLAVASTPCATTAPSVPSLAPAPSSAPSAVLGPVPVPAAAVVPVSAKAPVAVQQVPPSTVKKPVTAAILNDASSLGTPETRQAILQGAMLNIVWEADDGLSTPGSTAHISPVPIGGVVAPSVKPSTTTSNCFWDDSTADTPEPSTPAIPPQTAASDRYFYTPSSVTGTPGPAFTPLLSAAQLTSHNQTEKPLSSKAIVEAATTGVWQPPPESPLSQPNTSAKKRASLYQQQQMQLQAARGGAHNQNLAIPMPPVNSSYAAMYRGDGEGVTLLQPMAGFSLKIQRIDDSTTGSMSIVASVQAPVRMFINVCHHSSLPELSTAGKPYCLIGPQHQAIDEGGTLWSGFDVSVASSHVAASFADDAGETLRKLCDAVLAAVSAKAGITIAKEFKLARAGYTGKAPLQIRAPLERNLNAELI